MIGKAKDAEFGEGKFAGLSAQLGRMGMGGLDSCPHPNCTKKALSPIDMICIKCLKR